MKRIVIGSLESPAFDFDDDSIEIGHASVAQAVALVGQELSIDTFSPVVRDAYETTQDVYLFRSSDGKLIECAGGAIYAIDVTQSTEPSALISLPVGTPVWYYHEEELVGKFYLEDVQRQGRNKYKLNCVSAVGRLDKMKHGGGLFLRATFADVLSHIMRGTVQE